MIPFAVASQFTLLALLLAFIPGPDNLFVLMQSALRGSRAGIIVTAGLCTGLLVHTTAVACGVAAVFAASAAAFTALKVVGAGYLLYLALEAFRAASTAAAAQEPQLAQASGISLYLRGIGMNVTNPKVAIFFLAFLPQFVSPGNGPVPLQILQLGSLFIMATVTAFSAIALAASRLSRWLRHSPRAIPLMNKAAGCIFVGLAAKLALARP